MHSPHLPTALHPLIPTPNSWLSFHGTGTGSGNHYTVKQSFKQLLGPTEINAKYSSNQSVFQVESLCVFIPAFKAHRTITLDASTTSTNAVSSHDLLECWQLSWCWPINKTPAQTTCCSVLSRRLFSGRSTFQLLLNLSACQIINQLSSQMFLSFS